MGTRRRKEEPAIKTIDKALEAARAALEKKGTNLSIIDVEGRCSYADALLIASATNERQAAAIADSVEDNLRGHDVRPLTREGRGGWLLIDYGDLVVHVFVDELRAYYDLERLFSDAPRVAVPLGGDPDETPAARAAAAEARPRVFAQRRRFIN
jgi:ribosome-associated protein